VDDVLIQDPVCQTYFARRNGVHLRHDGQDLYFCSNRCRERFLNDKTPPEDRAGEG
jgi:YHS domain-containing protein